MDSPDQHLDLYRCPEPESWFRWIPRTSILIYVDAPSQNLDLYRCPGQRLYLDRCQVPILWSVYPFSWFSSFNSYCLNRCHLRHRCPADALSRYSNHSLLLPLHPLPRLLPCTTLNRRSCVRNMRTANRLEKIYVDCQNCYLSMFWGEPDWKPEEGSIYILTAFIY